ncbi:pilus assembly protein CpaF [Bifidobacterium bohemicum]|uniref:Flp pilus assembly protein, TadA n=1 Tax=Bifidobacterium bohemicum DSM 22767 TaxID=1437606 RepID=A0A086ZE45_9BIFI|nr:ATPase, T2SS/T4P/T4SS family [Bifidobacterium bohemicum]KFI44795.1 Flp pilus assembly protein, TadA [Bifidobacterium bohemicum DSM 22767]SCB93969.1 pilus assembly protein CpaF [Bifidobacterium bohemicum]
MMFGPLEQLSHDPALTDIAVTCEGRVWADRGAGMTEYHPPMPFRGPQAVRDYATQLCAQLDCRLDDACPIADASSVEGIRVHAVIAPLVYQGAAISIRFPSPVMPQLNKLAAGGLFPLPWFPLLCGLVRRRATILITGGTGAGKTTLLKALLGLCDPSERIICVEEVRELAGIDRGNAVSLVTRQANVEGVGGVGLPDLVKATLRMRPDRIILGECRGEEIADLLRAFNSGHHGGMVTLHADSVSRVPSRLVSLGLLAGLDPRALMMLAVGAFDVVLHIERINGKRRLVQIGRLVGGVQGLVGEPLAVWNGMGPAVPGPHWSSFVQRWSDRPNMTGMALIDG